MCKLSRVILNVIATLWICYFSRPLALIDLYLSIGINALTDIRTEVYIKIQSYNKENKMNKIKIKFFEICVYSQIIKRYV